MNKLFITFLAFLAFSFNVFAAVNLNTASQAELEALNGVGPAKAAAIVDYRKKNGNFKTPEDLNNVPGFGDKTVAKLKGQITVSAVADKVEKKK